MQNFEKVFFLDFEVKNIIFMPKCHFVSRIFHSNEQVSGSELLILSLHTGVFGKVKKTWIKTSTKLQRWWKNKVRATLIVNSPNEWHCTRYTCALCSIHRCSGKNTRQFRSLHMHETLYNLVLSARVATPWAFQWIFSEIWNSCAHRLVVVCNTNFIRDYMMIKQYHFDHISEHKKGLWLPAWNVSIYSRTILIGHNTVIHNIKCEMNPFYV